MKILLSGILLLFSVSSFAQCLTLKFIAYRIECSKGQCIQPAISPWPVRIDLNSNKVGTYKHSSSLGNTKVESYLKVTQVDTHYDLEIKTVYINQAGSFGEVKETLQTQDLNNFQGKEINGTTVMVGETQYFPRVGVFPESNFDLCQ